MVWPSLFLRECFFYGFGRWLCCCLLLHVGMGLGVVVRRGRKGGEKEIGFAICCFVDDVIRLCLFPFAILLIVQMRVCLDGCTHCLFVALLHMCCVWWLLVFFSAASMW